MQQGLLTNESSFPSLEGREGAEFDRGIDALIFREKRDRLFYLSLVGRFLSLRLNFWFDYSYRAYYLNLNFCERKCAEMEMEICSREGMENFRDERVGRNCGKLFFPDLISSIIFGVAFNSKEVGRFNFKFSLSGKGSGIRISKWWKERKPSQEINLYSFKYISLARDSRGDKGRRGINRQIFIKKQPWDSGRPSKIRPTRPVIGTGDNYLFSTNHRGTSFSLLSPYPSFLPFFLSLFFYPCSYTFRYTFSLSVTFPRDTLLANRSLTPLPPIK